MQCSKSPRKCKLGQESVQRYRVVGLTCIDRLPSSQGQRESFVRLGGGPEKSGQRPDSRSSCCCSCVIGGVAGKSTRRPALTSRPGASHSSQRTDPGILRARTLLCREESCSGGSRKISFNVMPLESLRESAPTAGCFSRRLSPHHPSVGPARLRGNTARSQMQKSLLQTSVLPATEGSPRRPTRADRSSDRRQCRDIVWRERASECSH